MASEHEVKPGPSSGIAKEDEKKPQTNIWGYYDPEEDKPTEDGFVGRSNTDLVVTVKSWTAVAAWKWVANDDTCGICRVAFEGCCPDCKFPGDDCPLVWGQCTHCFHIHCIMKWLNSQQAQQLCPMCRQEWRFR